MVLSYSSNSANPEPEEVRVHEIERAIPRLSSFLRVDSLRLLALQKVSAIAGKYNPGLEKSAILKIAHLIYEMCGKYENLDVDLICATITHETAFTWRETIRSPAGAMGLMQVMPETGRVLARHEGVKWTSARDILYNPFHNIRLGCRYLSTLIDNYNLDGGLAAYNGGESRARKWLASGRDDRVLFEETRGYIPAVLQLYDSFKD